MSYNGITKSVHCCFVTYINKECIYNNLLTECKKCNKITYSCDGTCVLHSSTYMTYLKHQVTTNQTLIKKYRLRTPHHKSINISQLHVKQFHDTLYESIPSY